MIGASILDRADSTDYPLIVSDRSNKIVRFVQPIIVLRQKLAVQFFLKFELLFQLICFVKSQLHPVIVVRIDSK